MKFLEQLVFYSPHKICSVARICLFSQ